MENDQEVLDASALCLECGMCCRGVLHDYVMLEPDDVERARQMEFVLVERKGKPTFAQPCPKLEGNACSVYRSRPSACVEYRCRLLDRFLAGDVDVEFATALIQEARARVARVSGLMPGQTFPELRRRWATGLDGFLSGDPDSAESECEAFLELTTLGMFLDRYFVLERETNHVNQRNIVA